MTFRSEDILVGLVAFGLVPWIAWTLSHGLRQQRLPIGRSYIFRDERPNAYRLLLAFYVMTAMLIAVIAVDLLFGLDVRFWI